MTSVRVEIAKNFYRKLTPCLVILADVLDSLTERIVGRGQIRRNLQFHETQHFEFERQLPRE